ncbi:hypothetical protein [Litoribaculum gwangyangense]|uniref:Uncharacterized protein n=1 Tax=Litoribaculum gwangyangense TaxID=1130722 RepID=A0ABP9CMX0_9FLAO
MKKLLSLLALILTASSYAEQVRHIETVNEAWYFHKGSVEKPFNTDDTVVWEKFTIPHSRNTEDILDDEDGYCRGAGGFQYQ